MSSVGKNSCPICGSGNVEIFFEVENIPLFCNVLHATRDDALATACGNMQLGFCHECTHIYNCAFDPARMKYTQTYENTLHFSPRFQAYADDLARDLIGRNNLHKRTIIEIGCGKGDFLKLMCELGENSGIGFDSSYQPELWESTGTEHTQKFEVIRDVYSEKYSYISADFIICRHVLEHIDSPRTFIAGIFESKANSYFEVPSALWTLRDLGVWDLIYEHCSYFTPQSLAHLFSITGFEILRLEEKFGGQFLGIELKRSASISPRNLPIATPDKSIIQLIRAFRERYRSRVAEWKRRLAELEGKRIIVWGSGSKGVTFLNVIKPSVEFVVDINRRKQGMYVAGTGQRIVAPEFLREYTPHAVIVMNRIYADEIAGTLAALGMHPEIHFG